MNSQQKQAFDKLRNKRINQQNQIVNETKYNRNGRYIEFTMPAGKYDPVSVMLAHGFHPAGYGQPFDIKSDSFKCSSSSD